MSNEQKLSPEEINKRVISGMAMVYDLFNEMNYFFRQVLDGLDSSEIEIRPLKKRFLLPTPKKKTLKTAADDYVKTHMGFMAEIGVGLAEDEEGDGIEDDDETEVDDKGIFITPESQFLVVRASLYNAKDVAAGSFKPFVVAAVLSSLKRSRKKKTAVKVETDINFQLKKGQQILRGAVLLEPSVKSGKEVSWMIPKYVISAKVSGILHRPLVYFDTDKKFPKFIKDLISMVETA